MTGCPVKVSIIIPVYNTERQLGMCLTSCISQTLFDIEIICVNDGSTDHSLSVLESFAQRDYRITVINKANGGLPSARNAGIAVATGKILMFLDSDDSLTVNACERVWLESLNGKFDILAFSAAWFPTIPAPNRWIQNKLTVRTHRIHGGFTPEILFNESGAKPFVWRQAFRKAFLDEHNLRFDEACTFGEDTVFDMEAYPHGKDFAFIADKLYNYRWTRPDSMMDIANRNLDQKLQKHLAICQMTLQYWARQGWLELYGQWYYEWLLDFMMPDILSANTQSPGVHLAQLKKLIGDYSLDERFAANLNSDRAKWAETVRNAVDTDRA